MKKETTTLQNQNQTEDDFTIFKMILKIERKKGKDRRFTTMNEFFKAFYRQRFGRVVSRMYYKFKFCAS